MSAPPKGPSETPPPWLRAKTFHWFTASFVPGAWGKTALLSCMCQAPGRTLFVSELSAEGLTAVLSKAVIDVCKRGCRRFSNYWYIKAVWSWEINKHSLESNLP